VSARPVLILGAGGHGKVVADALRAAGCEMLGFLDRNGEAAGPFGLPVLGSDDALGRFDASKIALAIGVGSTGDCTARRRLFQKGKAAGFGFVTIVHPRAAVSDAAVLREGVQIMAGAVVQAEAEIGENVIVNTGAIIDHDCRIGAHCHIAPGATLSGCVSLGADSHIGTGASLIQGVSLGERCLVAAGAAVVGSFGDDIRLIGVPARAAS